MVLNAIGVQSLIRDAGPQVPEHINCRSIATLLQPITSRRKAPIQLCPAPDCKERAAPVFGMICGKHKSASKKTVASWRAARRARKARAS